MNTIAAHKDELKRLLENLSSDTAVSGITFVALLDTYIMRLDANCSDINPPPVQINGELQATNIDSELRALLRATQNFKTARRAFPEISRRGSQAGAGYSPATDLRRSFQASTASPGRRPLSDVGQRVNWRRWRNQPQIPK
jgi:hypothetical protein